MKKSVKSIIEDVQEFHFGLGRYFLSIKERSENLRVEMFLDYLSRREEYIAEYLKKYLHSSDDEILGTWISIVPWLPGDIFTNCIKDLDLLAPLTLDDVLDIAIHYDDCLIDFFSILVRETEYKGIETLFSNLLNQAKAEEKKLARDVLWLHDM